MEHPESLLESYVAGTLSEAEIEQVLAHLETCDHCLAITERLWETTPLPGGLAALPSEPVDPEPVRVQRIEQRVINQIHRSEVAGRALWLGTEGFAQVSFALLRPLLEKLSGSEQ
ncbi:MAG: zf-HC2 domain-containing protein [Anaerolineae bacterium]|nr:zf-HC2 domain-containing protein [Anaerolineae bacterium]